MRSFPFKSPSAKFEESQQWHRWYAWRPVQASQGDFHSIWVWGEEVERRLCIYRDGNSWEYRIIDK